MTTILDLPNEILFMMDTLDETGVHNLCQTSTRFAKICKDPYFWKRRLTLQYPDKTDEIDKAFGVYNSKHTYVRLITKYGGITVGSLLGRGELMKRSGIYGEVGLINASKTLNLKDLNLIAEGASEGGHIIFLNNIINAIRKIAKVSRWMYNKYMEAAAKGGHMNIIRFMMKRGANEYGKAMKSAAGEGHMDIVKLMVRRWDKYQTPGEWPPYNLAMVLAAEGGHMKIIKYLMYKGATDYEGAMSWAARGGHMKIIRYMIKKGASDYNKAMVYAANGGHINIVRFMMKRGATEYDSAMENINTFYSFDESPNPVYLEIAKLLIGVGSTNINKAMDVAIIHKDVLFAKQLYDLGADSENALSLAVDKGDLGFIRNIVNDNEDIRIDSNYLDTLIDQRRLDIIRYLMENNIVNIEYGDEYECAATYAASKGYDQIVDYFIEHGVTNILYIFMEAVENYHMVIVEKLYELVVDMVDINEILVNASWNNHIDMAKFALNHGADNFEEAIEKSVLDGYSDMTNLIFEYSRGDI